MNMDRDLTRYFFEGVDSALQPTPRRAGPAAAPLPPPRTLRANDRAELVSYAGAWREPAPLPWEGQARDEEPDLEAAADGDDEDDGPDDGALYLPLHGGR